MQAIYASIHVPFAGKTPNRSARALSFSARSACVKGYANVWECVKTERKKRYQSAWRMSPKRPTQQYYIQLAQQKTRTVPFPRQVVVADQTFRHVS
jgi:hypothetical protein